MKQKRRRVLLGALGVLVLLIAAVLTLSQIAKAAYWTGPHLQELHIDMDRYVGDLGRIDTSQSALQDAVRQCNENAVPLPNACADYLRQCDQLITKAFQEIYSVNVSPALDALQVRMATYPEEVAETVGGSFSAELGGLFLNAALLDSFLADAGDTQPSVFDSKTFSCSMLRNVYIHEAIHALGFADDPAISSFMEAITEALTQQVTEFHGIPYENLTGYGEIKDLATQIIEAAPDIVCRTLQDGFFPSVSTWPR